MRPRSAVLRRTPRDANVLLPWSRLAGAVAILPALCVAAFAHGGSYRGPAGEVPPDSREPSDPPPPGGGDGTGTPPGNDPGGPITGGGGDVGPGTGGGTGGGPSDGGGNGGGLPPGGGGGSGVGTGGGGRRGGGGIGFDDWQFWWNHNKAEILALRGVLETHRGPPTGSGAHNFGHGVGSKVQTATKAAIDTVVVPLLRDVLADAREHFDVRSAAAIALAKIGDPLSVDPVRELARNANGKAHKVVVESSALSLGLYERDDAAVRDQLIETVEDPSESGSFTRPFSAIALGFQPAQGPAAVAVQAALLGVVSRRESGADVKPACLVALGMRGDASAIPALVRIVATGRAPGEGAVQLDDIDRSYAVQALGRIGLAGSAAAGETVVVDTLLACLAKAADDSPHVGRSAVVALGRVAPGASPQLLGRAVSALVDIATDPNPADSQSRHFALISLGRIGADARTGDAARRDCVAALGRVLDKGRPANLVQPYAAMGLGLVGRASSVAGLPVDEESIRKPLREKFADAKDPSSRSALALASGLTCDPRAADALLRVLDDEKANKSLRGYSALALGLIRDPRAVESVRAAVLESPDRELSLQSAIGAGLLGDPRAVDGLVAVLREPDRSQYVLGSVAVALGAIGDERAIAPLCAIVRDAKAYPELTRALAVVALGRIGDPRAVPTLARLATDFNYRAYVPATRELLTIL